MKNKVIVYLEKDWINVDGDLLTNLEFSIDLIENVLPDNVQKENVIQIDYNVSSQGKINFAINDGSPRFFDATEENYNKWIQPYVDIWQAKKDQQQQEQEQIQQEYNRFENRQARALVQLNQDFETAAQRAHVKSSLGFEVDANSTANENVNGLLTTIGDGTVQFCDYYNGFHELNKAQLETLQSEIIQNGQNLYAQKWKYRTAIEDCVDNEGLDAIVATIEFTYMDFSTAS